MALKTSFMMSCGFDCERMPKCHLAFLAGFLEAGAVDEECAPLAVESLLLALVDCCCCCCSSRVAVTSLSSAQNTAHNK